MNIGSQNMTEFDPIFTRQMGQDKDTALISESQPEPLKKKKRIYISFCKGFLFPIQTFSLPTLAFIMDATLLYSKAKKILHKVTCWPKDAMQCLKTKHSIFIQALSLHKWRKTKSRACHKNMYLDTGVTQLYVFIHL